MEKLKEIKEGWEAWLSGENKELLAVREQICNSCNWYVANICTRCGCLGPAKMSNPNSKCPIKKW